MNRFEGLIAAPFAPMSASGDVMYDRIEGYYDFLEKNKVVGAFINGSTGEGVSLSQNEKMRIVEEWTKRAKVKKTVKVITLVGGTSYVECIENALHAREQGVYGIALLHPIILSRQMPNNWRNLYQEWLKRCQNCLFISITSLFCRVASCP